MNQPLEVAAPKTPWCPPCPRGTVSERLLDFFTASGARAVRPWRGLWCRERTHPGALRYRRRSATVPPKGGFLRRGSRLFRSTNLPAQHPTPVAFATSDKRAFPDCIKHECESPIPDFEAALPLPKPQFLACDKHPPFRLFEHHMVLFVAAGQAIRHSTCYPQEIPRKT